MKKTMACWSSRRSFSLRAAVTILTFVISATAALTERTQPDVVALQAEPKELEATKADLGSLCADMQKLAQARPYEWSFTSDRFKSFKDYLTAGYAKVLEALAYGPEKV